MIHLSQAKHPSQDSKYCCVTSDCFIMNGLKQSVVSLCKAYNEFDYFGYIFCFHRKVINFTHSSMTKCFLFVNSAKLHFGSELEYIIQNHVILEDFALKKRLYRNKTLVGYSNLKLNS